MMKNTKKFLSAVLLVCMIVSMLPVSALANELEHSHSYAYAVALSPDCTNPGLGTYTCTCGSTYNEELSALGHTPGAPYVATEPTCTTAGSTAVKCTVCGTVLSTGVIPATGHTPSAPYVATEPTCTVAGSTAVKCTVCGTGLSTEPIAATGHKVGELLDTVASTCVVPGSQTFECAVCFEYVTVPIPVSTEHTYGEPSVTKAATCTEKGENTVKCTVEGCTESYTTEIEALGHTYENGECALCHALCEHSYVEASCEAPKTCAVCGLTEGDALGHAYMKATCTEPQTCGRCEATEGEALGHNYEYGVCSVCDTPCVHSGGTATCETLAVCEICNQPYGELGHSGGTATCAEPAVCEKCSQPYGSSLGHAYDEKHVCERCGEKEPLVKNTGGTPGISIAGGDTVHVGKTLGLSVQGLDDASATVIWSSEPASVATVDNGLVTGVAKGKATITADVGDKTATTEITVDDHVYDGWYSEDILGHYPQCSCGERSDEVASHILAWDKDKADFVCSVCGHKSGMPGEPAISSEIAADQSIPVGREFTMQLLNVPMSVVTTVTWTSNDESVVDYVGSIEFGTTHKFMALAAGEATITAEYAGGSVSRTITVVAVNDTATIEILEKRITINEGDIELENGNEYQLTATIEPDGDTKIAWSSDNPEIATVDENTGWVTGKAKGTATITARALDNSGASDSVKVYVYENGVGYITAEKDGIDVGESVKLRLVHPDVDDNADVEWSVYPSDALDIVGNGSNATVTGKLAGIDEEYITISAVYESVTVTYANMTVYAPTITVTGDDSVYVGKTITLTATVSPKYKEDIVIKWTSSDTSIATVDKNGVVTGVKADTVTITATAYDNDSIIGTKQITVKPVVISSVEVSGPAFVAVDNTIELKAQVKPTDAANKEVIWESSDDSVATVNEKGIVKGIKKGDVTITAISKADDTIFDKHSVHVINSVYLYYGNGTHFNGIHPMPFVSSDVWAGGNGVNVAINGIPLVPGRDFSCYSSPSGMIGVTLHPGVLRLLPQNAWHTIAIHSANGVASGHFSTGYFGYYNVYGVKTGDDSAPGLWALLCLLGISGAGIILVKSRKRKA